MAKGETSIKLSEKTLANERLYKETAFLTKTSPKQVEEIIDVVSAFTANAIKVGGFDTIRIPRFGSFQVKPKLVQKIEELNRKKNEAI